MIDREKHDLDIRILAAAQRNVESYSGAYFILTGSYSVEALTGSDISHNDLDANVFTDNLNNAQANIVDSLTSLPDLVLKAQRPAYIEYDLVSYKSDAKKVMEINFLHASRLTTDVFLLKQTSDKVIEVPTEIRTLVLLSGEEIPFRVKSLPYAIASWALRISGLLSIQKRQIRESDIDHFKKLLQQGYKYCDVLSTMSKHPQMEDQLDVEQVFTKALALLL